MVRIVGSLFSVDVIDPDEDGPAHARVCERIRRAILDGTLRPGSRLPSGRALAADLGLARNTVDWALGQLAADGYIVRRRGAGSFVAERLPVRDAAPRQPRRSRPPAQVAAPAQCRMSQRAQALRHYPGQVRPADATAFTPSLPPGDVFPRKLWNRLLAREAARGGDAYWHYGASNGLPALREAIAAHASAMRAVRCTPDQVIVVTSTQQAVELAARVLADPGDAAWMETPGYPPARHCLDAMGLRIVPVPVDAHGLDVAAGTRLASDARLAYVTPSHQYPLGVEMSLARRRALLAWAHDADACVIEDDYDGDYRYEGRPIAALQGLDSGRVVYVGSFNKILFPGLRIAYAIVPPALVQAFVDAKHLADGHTALLMQGVLAAFIGEGHLARHLRTTRRTFDARRRAFLAAADDLLGDLLLFGPARAGLHLCARWHDRGPLAGRDDRALAAACARAGIDAHPLSRYGADGGLVLGFAALPAEAARPALQRMRRVLLSCVD